MTWCEWRWSITARAFPRPRRCRIPARRSPAGASTWSMPWPTGGRSRAARAAPASGSRSTSARPVDDSTGRATVTGRVYASGFRGITGQDVPPTEGQSSMELRHRSDLELVQLHRVEHDEAAREALIMRHGALVRAIARRYAGRGFTFDDIAQSGYLGLIQAVDRFDPSRGVPLRGYATRMIE